VSCDTNTTTLNVIRGSDREFVIKVSIQNPCDAAACGDPFDLTGVTEIKALFRKTDETVLTVTKTATDITVLSATAGKIKVFLSDTNTALLKVGDAQSFEIEIQVGTITSIVQFRDILNVVDRVFA
jgi:hypothetical protein